MFPANASKHSGFTELFSNQYCFERIVTICELLYLVQLLKFDCQSKLLRNGENNEKRKIFLKNHAFFVPIDTTPPIKHNHKYEDS